MHGLLRRNALSSGADADERISQMFYGIFMRPSTRTHSRVAWIRSIARSVAPGRGRVRVPHRFDVLTMGRSSIDLYAHQIGVPITSVTSFDAYVGGCPTNIYRADQWRSRE